MGLFENLFKPRPEGSVERVVEAPLKASSFLKHPSTGPEEASAPDPETAFLTPKGYAAEGSNESVGGPQGFAPVIPSGKRPPNPVRRQSAPAPLAKSPASDEILLPLGDVLPKIPAAFLKAGQHDPKRELRFRLDDLSAAIARGRPGIALSCIAAQCPEIFNRPITDDVDLEVKLPLQKLVEQVSRMRTRSRAAVAPAAPAAPPPASRPPTALPSEKLKTEVLSPKPAPQLAPPPAANPVRNIPAFAPAVSVAIPPVAPPAPVVAKSAPPVVAPPAPVAPPPLASIPVAPAVVPPLTPSPAPAQIVTPALAPVKTPLVPVVAAPPPVVVPAPQPVIQAAPVVIAPPVEVAPVVAEIPPVAPAPAVVSAPVVTPPVAPVVPPVAEIRPLEMPPLVAPAPVPPVSVYVETPALSLAPPAPVAPPPPIVEMPVELAPLEPPAPVAELPPEPAQPVFMPPPPEPPLAEVAVEAPVETPVVEPIPAAPPEIAVAEVLPVLVAAPEPPPVESATPSLPSEPAVPPPLPAEPAPPMAAAPAPAAEEPYFHEPKEGMIDLSLAALVARAPRAIFAGDVPHIPEYYRLDLPFPMIERQLGTGSVSVSAEIFRAAIPPLLRHHFTAPEGVSVPIPLEEIFQNLPVVREYRSLMETPEAKPLAWSSPRPPQASVVLSPGPPTPVAPVEPPAPAPEPPPVVAEVPPEIPAAEPVTSTIAEPVPAAPVEVQPSALPIPVAETPAPSGINDAPELEHPVTVNLAPFQAFAPPAPVVEAGPEVITPAAEPEPVILSEAPAAGEPADAAAQVLRPANPAELAEKAAAAALDSETAEESGPMPPSAASPQNVEPSPEPEPRFAVLPPPETAPTQPQVPPIAIPEPETIAAFNPDLPPPVKIEEPAIAVAELRATVNAAPVPMVEPVFASATTSVPPPRLFRPVVLAPPPVSGSAEPEAPSPATTLVGPAIPPTGMISLTPSVEAPLEAFRFPTNSTAQIPVTPASMIQPSVVPAAAVPAAPTPQSLARNVFNPPAAPASALAENNGHAAPPANPVAPVAPPAAFVPPVQQAPAMPAPQIAQAPIAAPEPPPALHLHLPPVPAAAPAAPVHEPPVPALPLTRLDQHSLQSLFMTEEILDLPKIARLASALPGIQACVIASRGETHSCGNLPEGFQLGALRGLAPQVGAAADRLPIGELKNFTLYGEQFSISIFERASVSLCAIHRSRSFVPGVREKLVAVVDELSRS